VAYEVSHISFSHSYTSQSVAYQKVEKKKMWQIAARYTLFDVGMGHKKKSLATIKIFSFFS